MSLTTRVPLRTLPLWPMPALADRLALRSPMAGVARGWGLSVVACAVLTGCAAGGSDASADHPASDAPAATLEDLEDAFIVPDGKADDFFSVSAREFIVEGTDTVTLESELASASNERKLARVRELISYRHLAIAWFLNQYLIEKDRDAPNAGYGGFGGMAKASSYEELDVRAVDARTYAFRFRQVVAGRRNLLSLLPLRTEPDGTRTFTLTVGVPSNDELARLETNAEWYRAAPWNEWNPTTVDAARKRDLRLTVRPEVESKDAWLDHRRLMADGVLDIDVHFGWDYHAAYHERHARSLHEWLVRRGFRPPVANFAELTRRSGPYTRTMNADGRPVRVEVRVFYGKAGTETDPDTDAGGRVLEADMRESLRTRDVIVYSGHSGPLYGFALANWRRTDEGDLDDSELELVAMPADRYQVVVAEGCDTYMLGAAFGRNPNKPRLRNLDVLTTTSFSNAASPDTVMAFLGHLWEVDARGRHRPRTVKSLLTALDRNAGIGMNTMYGMHGIDDNPRLHPYAARDMIGVECGMNADCGGVGNLCVRRGERGPKFCTAACTDDAGCPAGYGCRPVASGSTIYGSACVPR